MDRGQELNANQERNDVASGSRPLASGGLRDAGGAGQDSMVHSDQSTATRSYREVTANDNSRLHVGDVHNYNWYLAPASTEPNADSPEAKL